jgi:hypothetical protein
MVLSFWRQDNDRANRQGTSAEEAEERPGMTKVILNPRKFGVAVICGRCKRMKSPVGRSVAAGPSYCNDDCVSYRDNPRPGSLWPGESEAQFGYPVGNDATEIRA